MTVEDLVCKFRPFAHAVYQEIDNIWDVYAPLVSENGHVIDISREEVIGFSYYTEHDAWLNAAKEVIPEETLAYHLLFWDEPIRDGDKIYIKHKKKDNK